MQKTFKRLMSDRSLSGQSQALQRRGNLPVTIPKMTTRFTNDVDDVQNITEAIVYILFLHDVKVNVTNI